MWPWKRHSQIQSSLIMQTQRIVKIGPINDASNFPCYFHISNDNISMKFLVLNKTGWFSIRYSCLKISRLSSRTSEMRCTKFVVDRPHSFRENVLEIKMAAWQSIGTCHAPRRRNVPSLKLIDWRVLEKIPGNNRWPFDHSNPELPKWLAKNYKNKVLKWSMTFLSSANLKSKMTFNWGCALSQVWSWWENIVGNKHQESLSPS